MVCMSSADKIMQADPAELGIVEYPDPRLKEVCTPVGPLDPEVREHLGRIIDRMFELMFEHRGVGLAGPQVGITVRLFVASPSFDPADRRVYIDPEVVALDGKQEDDEGCLSFPGIHCKVRRAAKATIEATGLDGNRFSEEGEGLTARLYQHETDHLDGVLLTDRMSAVAKIANRRTLKQMQERFAGV